MSTKKKTFADLKPEEKKEILAEILKYCKVEDNHIILESNYRKPLGGLREVTFKGVKLRNIKYWFHLIKNNFPDFTTEMLKLTLTQGCLKKNCMSHVILYDRANGNTHKFENFTDDTLKYAFFRLTKKCKEDTKTGCLRWTGGKNDAGYGTVGIFDKDWLVHRVAYQLYHKETLEENIAVCHSPANPSCPNRDCFSFYHLIKGTADDNAKHKKIAGTQTSGEAHSVSRYSDKQIEDLKDQLKDKKFEGKTLSEISEATGICVATVQTVKKYGTRTTPKGKSKKRIKLTHDDIRKIRKLYPAQSQEDIAKQFNRSRTCIEHIILKDIYKYVEDTEEKQIIADETRRKENIENRKQELRSNTVESKLTGCWEWQGGKSVGGYGVSGWNGKSKDAHIVSWILYKNDGKPVPKGKLISHTCRQNRSCVNPEHLEIGTKLSNAQDRIRDGTQRTGERCKQSIFSDALRAEILEKFKTKTVKEVYEEYKDKGPGYTYQQICSLKQHKRKRESEESESEE